MVALVSLTEHVRADSVELRTTRFSASRWPNRTEAAAAAVEGVEGGGGGREEAGWSGGSGDQEGGAENVTNNEDTPTTKE